MTKAIYRFSEMPIKILMSFFTEKFSSGIHMEAKKDSK
jgi:hypothetical protein